MATMTDRDEERERRASAYDELEAAAREDIDDLVWDLERGIQQAAGAVNDAAIRALVQNKDLAQFKKLQNVEDELHQTFEALRALMVSR
jgi:hypothetical protein